MYQDYKINTTQTKEAKMAKWTVKQTVEYWAEGIEAESAEEARKIYLKDQESYYYAVDSEDIFEEEEEVDEDEEEDSENE
jgi:hypothetical protein